MNTPNITDWISALSALGAALFTLVAVVIAYRAWRVAKQTLKAAERSAEQAEETVVQMRMDSAAMREDSASSSRPYLSARIVPGLWGDQAVDLVVQNYGRTAAYNFTMGIDSPDDSGDDFKEGAAKFASSRMMIPPGASIRILWYRPEDSNTEPPKESGYAEAVVQLRYTDIDGVPYDLDPSITLDKSAMGPLPLPPTGPKATSGHDKHERDRNHALRTIARYLGELTR